MYVYYISVFVGVQNLCICIRWRLPQIAQQVSGHEVAQQHRQLAQHCGATGRWQVTARGESQAAAAAAIDICIGRYISHTTTISCINQLLMWVAPG